MHIVTAAAFSIDNYTALGYNNNDRFKINMKIRSEEIINLAAEKYKFIKE